MIKKRYYLSPRVSVTEVMEFEGIICNSPSFNVKIQELENANELDQEEFYFKS